MPASISVEAWVVEDLGAGKLPARSIAAALQNAGVGVRLVDLNATADEIAALAARDAPQLVIFSLLFADRMNEHLALLVRVREVCSSAHLTLVGPLPALAPDQFLGACPALDSVIDRAPEIAAVELARIPETAAGAVRRSSSFSRPRPKQRAPATFVVPVREDSGITWPARPMPTFRGYGYATIQASRGCYHACAFCLPAAYGRHAVTTYSRRAIQDVVGEMEELYRRGVRLFLFDDDQFLAPGRMRTTRVDALGEALAHRDMHVAFTVKCRADDVTPVLFQALAKMGLVRAFVGIESGSQPSLDYVEKGATVKQNLAALELLDSLGIVADFRMLMFHPATTLDMVTQDVQFLQRVLPHVAIAFDWREIQVYAGTPLARRLAQEGRGTTSLGGGLEYVIEDERVELLRRLARVVWPPTGGPYARWQQGLNAAWYAVLLAHRLESRDWREGHDHLRQAARSVNQASVRVWQAMLEFVERGDIHDVASVNSRAEKWARSMAEAASVNLGGPAERLTGGSDLNHTFEIPSL